MKGVRRFLGLDKGRPPLARLRLDLTDTVVYAVGDVHGCLRELLALERNIAEDARALPGRKLIVMLGDYVDRGPSSAQVLDHLAGPAPAGFERVCLAGNHELAMLDFLEGRLGLPVGPVYPDGSHPQATGDLARCLFGRRGIGHGASLPV